MSRYLATVRETLTVEYDVMVEAESRNAAFRVAEDPDEWENGAVLARTTALVDACEKGVEALAEEVRVVEVEAAEEE